MSARERSTREEIARREVGHTDVRPPVARVLVGLFLATILVIPAMQLASDLRGHHDGPAGWWERFGPRRIVAAGIAGAAAAAGGPWARVTAGNHAMLAAIKDCEDDLDRQAVVGRALRPPVQEFLSSRLGAGNEKVYCGRDRWLFYRPAVDHVTGPGFLDPDVLERRAAGGSEWRRAPQPDPRPAILQFRDQLAARGIDLILLPVPVKAAIEPQMLAAGAGAPLANPSWRPWLEEMAAAGVRIFDPTPTLLRVRDDSGEPAYLADDTHWRPEAVAAVARDLAAAVAARDDLPPSPRFSVHGETVVLEGVGDLESMLELSGGADVYPDQTVTTTRVVADDETYWRPDRDADILLLGDSYTNIYSLAGMGWGEAAGFAEQLSRALGRPLDTIVRNDDGAHATRMMLSRELARGRDRLDGKRLVIWEFTARELSGGDWRLLPLNLGAPAPGQFLEPSPGDSLAVRGTIAEIAPVPLPRSAPYADYLTAVHLVDVGEPGSETGDGEALVYVWAMRDYRWTAGAHLRVGQRIDLVLHPWSDVSDRLGTVSRGELLSDRLLAAPACFAAVTGGVPADRLARERVSAASLPAPLPAAAPVAGADLDSLYRETCLRMLRLMIPRSGEIVPAQDGWLLVTGELRYAASGPFWGADAARANTRCPAAVADPVPAIVDFARQLARRGTDLVLVPVPARCVVDPESVLGEAVFPAGETPRRMQPHEQEFLDILRREGVEVVDATELLLAARGDGGDPVFLPSDTHWTPRGALIAARAVAGFAASRSWYADLPKLRMRTETGVVEHEGGLFEKLADLTGETRPPQDIRYRAVLPPAGADEAALPRRAPRAPVVVIGDSNVIWWKDQNASFQHQLAGELGLDVDCLYTEGGGSYVARRNLADAAAADPGYLAGKKLVVWCLTIRAVVNSRDGWPPVELDGR